MQRLAPLFLFNVIFGAMEFLLPIKFSEAHASIAMTAVLFSVISVCSIVLDIPSGKLSDRIGRERLIAYSMVMVVGASLILYFSDSLVTFFIAAALFGISYGLNWSPLLALIGDGSDETRGAAFGRFVRILSLGEGIAPLIVAAIIIYFRTNASFLLVAGIAVLCLILILREPRKTPEVPAEADVHFSYRNTLRLFRESLPMNLFLVIMGFFVAFFWESVWFTQPLIGFYENTVLDSAIIVAAFAIPSILFSDILGKAIDRFGEKRVFLSSATLSVISFLAFYLSVSLVAKVTAVFFAAIGVLGIWLVMDVLTARLHAPAERGEFFGILETVRDIAYLVSPLFIAFTYKFIGLDGIFAVNAGAALLLLAWGFLVFRNNRARS